MISADGGIAKRTGSNYAPGGGGRIAIWYETSAKDRDLLLEGDSIKRTLYTNVTDFAGTISVDAGLGNGARPATDGTIFWLTVPAPSGMMLILR